MWGRSGTLCAAAVAAGMLAAPAFAQRDGNRQVLIESRFVNVGFEFSAGLGVNWGGVTGFYDSTGAQPPADGRASGAFGSFNIGATGWFSSGLGGIPLGGGAQIGRIDIGAGLGLTPFFGSGRTPIAIQRHNNAGIDDVTLRQSIDLGVDLKAVGRIPIQLGVAPAVNQRGAITLNLEPEIGIALTRTTTTFRSDQFFQNGTDETRRDSGFKAGFLWGLGVSTPVVNTKLPLFGDIPLLGRMFYRSRYIPGTELVLPSISGFTEFGRTKGHTSHQVGAELIIIITPHTLRPGE